MGVQVNSLELVSEKNFIKGQDYVMRVKVHSLDHYGVLRGDIIFSRNLDEITSH